MTTLTGLSRALFISVVMMPFTKLNSVIDYTMHLRDAAHGVGILNTVAVLVTL